MSYSYGSMLTSVVAGINSALGRAFVPCVNGDLQVEIEKWGALYAGEPDWLNVKRGVFCSGLAGGIAGEVARLVTLEMKSEVTGDDAIDAVYQRTLRGIRAPVEQGCALGGMLIKPYLDAAGLPDSQFIRGDRFFPLSFSSDGKITGCALMEQMFIGKTIYSRVEVYLLERRTLNVYNLAFVSNIPGQIGTEVELTAVPAWAGFLPEAQVAGVDRLPFGYFRVPLANAIDPDSPLGVSIFSRAAIGKHSLLKEADLRYSNSCWEYEATQAAVHIASSLLGRDANGAIKYPTGRDRLYRAVEYSAGAADKPLLEEYSPEIRSVQIFAGFQAQVRLIEFNCGLAYGTVSDPSTVDKTAQEVRSSKQRLYATVTDLQLALQNALTDYVAALALLMKRPMPVVSFTWDDSIIVDSESLQRSKMLEFTSGIIDEVQYFVDVYGMSEDAALARVEAIKARRPDVVNEPLVTEDEE